MEKGHLPRALKHKCLQAHTIQETQPLSAAGQKKCYVITTLLLPLVLLLPLLPLHHPTNTKSIFCCWCEKPFAQTKTSTKELQQPININ